MKGSYLQVIFYCRPTHPSPQVAITLENQGPPPWYISACGTSHLISQGIDPCQKIKVVPHSVFRLPWSHRSSVPLSFWWLPQLWIPFYLLVPPPYSPIWRISHLQEINFQVTPHSGLGNPVVHNFFP